jgi:hypothetical protein
VASSDYKSGRCLPPHSVVLVRAPAHLLTLLPLPPPPAPPLRSVVQWGPRTMSLSRSEEMHRLTENVYKVSLQRRAESAPVALKPEQDSPCGRMAGALWGLSAPALECRRGEPALAAHRWPRPPSVPRLAAERAAPPAWGGAPTPTALLGPRAPSVHPPWRRGGLSHAGPGELSDPLRTAADRSEAGGGVGAAGCRGPLPCARLARRHRGALPGAVMPAFGHFLLNRLSLYTTPRVLMDVAQGGRSSAGSLDR